MNTTKMKAQPSAIKRISHHESELLDLTLTVGAAGESIPVTDGSGGSDFVLELDGTSTRLERQRLRPGMTLEESPQFAETHVPPLSSWLELEHARQLLGPGPEQLEQLESQD